MDVAETLGQLALFADLSPSQLEAIAHSHDEDVFAAGERVLRRGLSGADIAEHQLEPHPLHEYESEAYRRELALVLVPVLAAKADRYRTRGAKLLRAVGRAFGISVGKLKGY